MNQSMNESMNESIDISMNPIDNITLTFFANKLQYEHVVKKKELFNNNEFTSDKKFYKKRIIDLTKKLFRNGIDDLQLYDSFNCYIKSCINHLKFIDKKDIIQDKYNTMIVPSGNIVDDDVDDDDDDDINNYDINNYDINNCDILLTKNEVKQINLDTFVIKKKQKEKIKILPKKEIINIHTKEYKTKGIKAKGLKAKGLPKKKNINNIYEESDKKEK